jgi:hypothetical protein
MAAMIQYRTVKTSQADHKGLIAIAEGCAAIKLYLQQLFCCKMVPLKL